MARFGHIGQQYTDDSGNPLREGFLYFYESGTTTPKTTYADVDLTIPNTNPVPLTAAGRQPNIFFNGTAKVILTDANYRQIEALDPEGEVSGAEFSPWSFQTTYSIGDIATGSDGRRYQSLTGGNIGNDPTTGPPDWTEVRLVLDWSSLYSFGIGDLSLASDGFLYVSKTSSNLGNDPVIDDGTNWGSPAVSEFTIGDVVLSGDSTKYVPPSWLPGDNTQYNETTYASLFALLGRVPVDGLISDPATAPAGFTNAATWAIDNDYLAIVHQTTPFVTIYSRSGDAFTKLANPATLPTGTGNGCAYDPSTSTYLAVVHSTSPFVTIYSRSGSTHTKLTNPATLPTGVGSDCCWDSSSTYLVVGHSNSPYITIYKRSGSTFTKLANPAALPAGSANSCQFDSTDTYLAVAHDSSPYLTVYKRSGDTFTKIADPATLPTANGVSIAWNPAGDVLVHASATEITFYSFDSATDTVTKFDPELTNQLPSSAITHVSFSRDGRYFLVMSTSSGGDALFSVVGESFIAAELNTLNAVTNNYEHAAWGWNDEYMVTQDSNSPYVTYFKGIPLTPKLTADENGKIRGYVNTGL